jgi:hypothetical protein
MAGTILIRVTGSLAATAVVYGVYRVAQFIYAELTSPLRDLPGPKSPSLLYGNFKEIFESVSKNASSMHIFATDTTTS